MRKTELIKREKQAIIKKAKFERQRLGLLSKEFDYEYYSRGYVKINTFSPTFDDYLELSAKLPENELLSYDLYWYHKRDDSLQITHKVVIDDIPIYYRFIVGDVENTLNRLTEGKCKVIEEMIDEKQFTYTTLSCDM